MGLLLLISLLYLPFCLLALPLLSQLPPLLLSQLLPLISHFLLTLHHLHLHLYQLILLLPPGLSALGDLEMGGLEISMSSQSTTDSPDSPHQWSLLLMKRTTLMTLWTFCKPVQHPQLSQLLDSGTGLVILQTGLGFSGRERGRVRSRKQDKTWLPVVLPLYIYSLSGRARGSQSQWHLGVLRKEMGCDKSRFLIGDGASVCTGKGRWQACYLLFTGFVSVQCSKWAFLI